MIQNHGPVAKLLRPCPTHTPPKVLTTKPRHARTRNGGAKVLKLRRLEPKLHCMKMTPSLYDGRHLYACLNTRHIRCSISILDSKFRISILILDVRFRRSIHVWFSISISDLDLRFLRFDVRFVLSNYLCLIFDFDCRFQV